MTTRTMGRSVVGWLVSWLVGRLVGRSMGLLIVGRRKHTPLPPDHQPQLLAEIFHRRCPFLDGHNDALTCVWIVGSLLRTYLFEKTCRSTHPDLGSLASTCSCQKSQISLVADPRWMSLRCCPSFVYVVRGDHLGCNMKLIGFHFREESSTKSIDIVARACTESHDFLITDCAGV